MFSLHLHICTQNHLSIKSHRKSPAIQTTRFKKQTFKPTELDTKSSIHCKTLRVEITRNQQDHQDGSVMRARNQKIRVKERRTARWERARGWCVRYPHDSDFSSAGGCTRLGEGISISVAAASSDGPPTGVRVKVRVRFRGMSVSPSSRAPSNSPTGWG